MVEADPTIDVVGRVSERATRRPVLVTVLITAVSFLIPALWYALAGYDPFAFTWQSPSIALLYLFTALWPVYIFAVGVSAGVRISRLGAGE